jgi:hypothetical protein
MRCILSRGEKVRKAEAFWWRYELIWLETLIVPHWNSPLGMSVGENIEIWGRKWGYI